MAHHDYEDREPTPEERERYYDESLAVGWALGRGATMPVAVWLGIKV